MCLRISIEFRCTHVVKGEAVCEDNQHDHFLVSQCGNYEFRSLYTRRLCDQCLVNEMAVAEVDAAKELEETLAAPEQLGTVDNSNDIETSRTLAAEVNNEGKVGKGLGGEALEGLSRDEGGVSADRVLGARENVSVGQVNVVSAPEGLRLREMSNAFGSELTLNDNNDDPEDPDRFVYGHY